MTDTVRPAKRPYAARMAPEQRREQLLDAALHLIVTQGVHKVSIDAVAKEAGVTRPVVYGHFDDSNSLLRASLAREEQRAVEQWATVMQAAAAHESPVAAATAGFHHFLDAVQSSPELWRAVFLLADSSTPQFRARIERGRELAVQGLEALVRRTFARVVHDDTTDGTPDHTDVPLLARMLLALMWESGRLVLADPDTYPPERLTAFAESAIGVHLRAVTAPRSP